MEIRIKAQNLNKVLKSVEDRTQAIKDKTQEMVRQTTELGAKEASLNFSSAWYDGTNDVKVTSRVYKKTGVVTASGRTALFIEFGTGVHYGGGHPDAESFGYYPGSYGPNGLKDYWFYKGERGTNGLPSEKKPGMIITHGNPANRCMYNARRKVERNAQRIARRVFK